eukprot:GHUV01040403.1.p1 GENE.GHUV01040403.1~~GHUV01040403.1.p1  ORF type:complete len:103 (+),score=12.93 GHUV01040403.1:363-671(+)
MFTSCMPAFTWPPVIHSSCLPAWHNKQPGGMATGKRRPSASHTCNPGKRLLPADSNSNSTRAYCKPRQSTSDLLSSTALHVALGVGEHHDGLPIRLDGHSTC